MSASVATGLRCANDARAGASLSIAFSILQLAVKAGANVLIVRITLEALGAREYGIWIIIQSITAYLLLADFGLGQTVVNFVGDAFARQEFRRVNTILSNAFALYWVLVFCALACCAFAISLPLDKLLLGTTDRRFAGYFLTFAALALLRVPFTVFTAALTGMRDVPARLIYELASPMYILGATVLVLRLGGGLLLLIAVTGIGLAAISALSYPLLRARHHKGFAVTYRLMYRPEMSALYKNSIGFFCISIAILVQRNVPNILAGRMIGLEVVPGVFAIQLLLRAFALPVVDSLSRSIQPYLIQWNVEQQNQKVRFITTLSAKVSILVGIGFLGGLYLFGDAIWELWLGKGHYPGKGALVLLGFAFLFDIWLLAPSNYLIAINRHRRLAFLNIAFAAAQVCFGAAGCWLWHRNPLIGMCAGLLVASVTCQLCALGVVTINEFSFRLWHFARELLMRPALAIGTAVALVLWLRSVVQHEPLSWIYDAMLAAIIPVSTAVVLMSPTELRWLSATAPRLFRSKNLVRS